MEYAPHGSLKSLFGKIELSALFKVKAALDVAKGMNYLHSKKIIHRDLKPGNVLVSSLDPASLRMCKFVSKCYFFLLFEL